MRVDFAQMTIGNNCYMPFPCCEILFVAPQIRVANHANVEQYEDGVSSAPGKRQSWALDWRATLTLMLDGFSKGFSASIDQAVLGMHTFM